MTSWYKIVHALAASGYAIYRTFDPKMSDQQLVDRCRKEIERELGWGPVEKWTNRDFERLSELIAGVAATRLSATTLKRVWGRIKYHSAPSTTTLDALAVFAGYEHWRDFRIKVARKPTGDTPTDLPPQPKRKPLFYLIPLAFITLAGVLITQVPSVSSSDPVKSMAVDSAFTLDVRPVTTGVPNSVIFTYDARAAGTDSVFLQQDWDPRRRVAIDPAGDTHTSIYYLPGFYLAKLVVGDRIVQERKVYVRSNGWVGLVRTEPTPTYLPAAAIREGEQLQIAAEDLAALNISLAPTPPITILTTTDVPENLSTEDFTFRTRLRHDYAAGAGACQFARVLLLLKNGVITIPLSAAGCVAELNLYAGGQNLSGRTTDLSAFGVLGTDFVDLECTGQNGTLNFAINGRHVLQLDNREGPRDIIGIRYEFVGTGRVEECYLPATPPEPPTAPAS